MPLLPISRRSSEQQTSESWSSLASSGATTVSPPEEPTTSGSDGLKTTVKNTFLDVLSDYDGDQPHCDIHQLGAHTCSARLSQSAWDLHLIVASPRSNDDGSNAEDWDSEVSGVSMVENTPLNDGMSRIYPMRFLPPPILIPMPMTSCASVSVKDEESSCKAQMLAAIHSPSEPAYVAPPACNAVKGGASHGTDTSSLASEIPAVAQQILLQIPLGSICGSELLSAQPREHRVMVKNTFTKDGLEYIDFRLVLGPSGSLSAQPCLFGSYGCSSAGTTESADAATVPTSMPPCHRPPGRWSGEHHLEMGTKSIGSLSSTSAEESTAPSRRMSPFMSPTASWDMKIACELPQRSDEDGHGKSRMVCRHWKLKGWCKYQTNCKFMHPENKRGVGATVAHGAALSLGRLRPTPAGPTPMPLGLASSVFGPLARE